MKLLELLYFPCFFQAENSRPYNLPLLEYLYFLSEFLDLFCLVSVLFAPPRHDNLWDTYGCYDEGDESISDIRYMHNLIIDALKSFSDTLKLFINAIKSFIDAQIVYRRYQIVYQCS